MLAESNARRFVSRGIETSPMADPRVLSIGADHPAAAYVSGIEGNRISLNAIHARAPPHRHAGLARAIDQHLMQPGSANADSPSLGKRSPNRHAGAVKPNTAERERLPDAVQSYTQAPQRTQRTGHQSFAARFVDGWPRGIGHCHVETL
jgi:hypothetical protein